MSDLIINQEFIENRPLSYSSLKEFRLSPKHYIHYLTKVRTVTPAMILGSAAECLILEPELFDKKYLVHGKIDRRTTKGKEAYLALLDQAKVSKKTLITEEIVNEAKICSKSVLEHPEAKLYLDNIAIYKNKKVIQKKLKWTDKATNLPLIGYVDFESNVDGQEFIVDLKVFNNSDPDKFTWMIKDRQMYLQAGMYLMGYHKTMYRFPDFIFIVVESVEPYNTTIIYCDNKFNEVAKDELEGTLKAFRYCMDNNQFDKGYDFRLFGTRSYFRAEIPKFYYPKFSNYD